MPQKWFDFINCNKNSSIKKMHNGQIFTINKRHIENMKMIKNKQARKVRQTLAHVLHKNWPDVAETFIFFVILRGRLKPQPSQGRVSFLFSNASCIEAPDSMLY